VTAGVVLYAKDLARLSSFYEHVLGLVVDEEGDGHRVLVGSEIELALVAIPAELAARIEIADPPARREGTPIKVAFAVADLATARALAPGWGGSVDGVDAEWTFRGRVVCDGQDPEGNVVQLRSVPAP